MKTASGRHDLVGCVVVGRNEAARLAEAIHSAQAQADYVVYVDSGSSDDSAAIARSLGTVVIELDSTQPFTAARAYNAGVAHFAAFDRPPAFIQFLDGDAHLVPGWISVAINVMSDDAGVAVVSGRRREADSRANVWHRLIDMEWNTRIGDLEEFGPDTFMRLDSVLEAAGFAESMIAGEEPELALRFRGQGRRIVRVDADVSVHDIALRSWRGWWRRVRRGGFGFAECAHRHFQGPHRWRVIRPCASQWTWVVAVPALGVACSLRFGIQGLLVALVPQLSQLVRIARYRMSVHDDHPADALLYAASCMIGKLPELLGQIEYLVGVGTGKRRGLIEYRA